MAKRTNPRPQAAATAQDVAPATDATVTQSKIEEAAVLQGTEGNPTPPAMGNEGTAAEAEEGQSSSANPAETFERQLDYQQQVRQLADNYQPSDLKAALTSLGAEPSLIVTGPRQGRWRIGRKFSAVPVTLLVSELTEDELKALGADKALTVVVAAPPY